MPEAALVKSPADDTVPLVPFKGDCAFITGGGGGMESVAIARQGNRSTRLVIKAR